MQKDIQTSKGEQKSDFTSTAEKVGDTAGHKMKQVGHDINAGLKENIGVGVGNYSSGVDRMESKKHEEKYEKKKDELEKEREEKKEQKSEETGMLGHKIQEIGHTVNASLKQNVGIGIGNYSSEVDKERAEEHQEKYEEKVEETKKKLEEKKEDVKEKINQGEMGIYSHKLQELGHNVNAKLKETIGLGIGDYSSEVDRKIAEEHREGYMEKVKEEGCTEVSDSRPIVHKLKEVAHVVNANLKELIGVGVGNYSSEIDRELIDIHHHKYEEKIHPNNTNQDEELSSSQDEDLKKKRKSEKKDTKKFDKNEKKFDKGEKKFDKKDEKGFEKKFDKKDEKKFEKDEKKFDKDEKRSDKNEKKFDKGEKKFDKKDEKGFDKNFDKKDEKKFEKDEERPATYEEVVENKF